MTKRRNSHAALLWPLLMGFATLVGSACQTTAQGTRPPHHTDDGFRNNYPHEEHGFGGVLKWKLGQLVGLEPDRADPELFTYTLADNDPAWLQANQSKTTVTWIGHSTLLLQIAGVNILTDPHFTERASPVDWAGPIRHAPPGLALAELPPIDIVVISHNHYDHLDLESLRLLNEQWAPAHRPTFLVPLKNGELLRGEGIEQVVELDWWESRAFGDLTVQPVPVQHFSARTLWDRNEMLWSGWVILHPTFRFYFGGDTGYSQDFRDVGARLGPFDLAALPIGAYAPRWFMRSMHINPAEAVQAHSDLRADRSIAIHWGTFAMTDEPLDEPPRALRAALAEAGIAEERFWVFRHGETRVLEQSSLPPMQVATPNGTESEPAE